MKKLIEWICGNGTNDEDDKVSANQVLMEHERQMAHNSKFDCVRCQYAGGYVEKCTHID